MLVVVRAVRVLRPNQVDRVRHMKYIDHFYQLLIKSMLTYLTGVYGQA